MQGPLNIAIGAARAAGTIMLRQMERLDRVKVAEKRKNDYVSEVDRQCEAVIIETLQKAHPDHGFLGEESGRTGNSDWTWIIDPLDGTLNYLQGIPHFAVSIALQHKTRLEVGVVYDPFKQELFTATRGGGAQLNDKRIRVSERRSLDGAVLGTGFPFRENDEVERYMQVFRTFTERTAGLRRPGAAALDLVYVAAGRYDGFWEFGLSAWDMAAGALIAKEAGAIVADADGSERFLDTGNIVTATPRVYREMHGVIGPLFQRSKHERARSGT
ncbi:MAG: inositol monophosphatase family protein [Pseudomonadota bacterium]